MSLNDAERSTLVNLYMDRAWATYRDAKLAANACSRGVHKNDRGIGSEVITKFFILWFCFLPQSFHEIIRNFATSNKTIHTL